jgi:hypothetical protein
LRPAGAGAAGGRNESVPVVVTGVDVGEDGDCAGERWSGELYWEDRGEGKRGTGAIRDAVAKAPCGEGQ